jgi:phosphoribosylaminoimidazole-succinocarboxamide synthase
MISTDALDTLYEFVFDVVEEREIRLRDDRNHPDACRHCVENEEALIRDLWRAIEELDVELKARGHHISPEVMTR